MPATWVVVADSARARIFTVDTEDQRAPLKQVKELLHPESRSHERDLTTDANGRTFDSEGPGRHAMSENVSPKKHEAWKLCRDLADDIEKARAQSRFNRLVLIAAPAFLGQLRKTLSPATARMVIREIDKDLAHMDESGIGNHLPSDVLD